ncbi:hypothetical protein, partial [Cytobacillus oceanisediminis]|uniref:hypothetical protein n=1 Tax=Cytobacillus oceanisediminis TaxID=665099 RepID=UPI001C92D49F
MDWMIEVSERVRMLGGKDEELEGVGEGRVVMIVFGERRNVKGVGVNECRVDEVVLYFLLKE